MSSKFRQRAPRTTFGSLARLAGRILVPSAGLAFALWGAVVVTGLAAPGPAPQEKVATASTAYVHLPVAANPAAAPLAKSSQKTERAHASGTGKADRPVAAIPSQVQAKCADVCNAAKPGSATSKRHWSEIFGAKQDTAFATDPARQARFTQVASKNRLTPAKLASLFGVTESAVARADITPAGGSATPATERFGSAAAVPGTSGPLVLAYADPSPAGPNGALAALSAVTPQDDGALASQEDEANDADGTALFPDYENTPVESPLPIDRPSTGKPQKAEKIEPAPREDAEPAPREAAKPKREREQKLAYARPDNPAEERGGSSGNGLKNLFSRPRAGRGVAVYDISAAKVYMPDGSVLEAHSGIGKMADNPKYAHVKMNGPTPPHTYNLKMREKRFHGVEAIRMLPVDGKNKHGRDGFLTHSYLLRGGRAESHGCVAFKDYKKFLNAFKQGKVKQMIVVPGGGNAIARKVQRGRDA